MISVIWIPTTISFLFIGCNSFDCMFQPVSRIIWVQLKRIQPFLGEMWKVKVSFKLNSTNFHTFFAPFDRLGFNFFGAVLLFTNIHPLKLT